MAIKVVCNERYGGFSLSNEAVQWLAEHGIETETYSDLPRHHPMLVKCVEELGDMANGNYAAIAIVALRGNKYRIDEYDGMERVVEPNEAEWTVVDPSELK